MNKYLFRAITFAAGILLTAMTSALEPDYDISPRIVGGTVTEPGTTPYMAALVGPGSNLYLAQFCGGTVVDRFSVLTAAHCVASISASDLRIVTGIYDLISDTPDEIIQASGIFIHPNYDPQSFNNDFAVIKLATPTSASPIGLYSGTSGLAGNISTVLGWGSTNRSGNIYPTELMQADLSIVSNSSCSASNGSGITNQMLCAIAAGKDTCFADSGGPLLTRVSGQYIQAGITSFGVTTLCATSGFPGVYSRVSSAVAFIRSHAPLTYFFNGILRAPPVVDPENRRRLPAIMGLLLD